MSVFVSVEKKKQVLLETKKWLRIIYKAEKALIALLLTKNSKKQRELKSKVNPHPFGSIFQMMCVCLYVHLQGGGSLQVLWHLLLTLQTLVVTSSSFKSGQEIQLTFPRQWEQMLVYHRNALWWPLYVVRYTPLSVWPLPLIAATTNLSCTPETSGAFQTLKP